MHNNYKKFLLIGALSLVQYNAIAGPGNMHILNSNRIIMNNSQPQHYHQYPHHQKTNKASIRPSIDISNLINSLDDETKKKFLAQQKIEELKNKNQKIQTNTQSKLKR